MPNSKNMPWLKNYPQGVNANIQFDEYSSLIDMFDEPTAALSPKFREEIIEKISELRKINITVLIVELNARLSLARSDRGYIFSNGKVVHTNSASHILTDPQINEYFLGTKKDE